MNSFELENPVKSLETSKIIPQEDSTFYDSSSPVKSTRRDTQYSINSVLVDRKKLLNGLVFQDQATFLTRNENSLFRNITTFPACEINNSEFLSTKSGITEEMLEKRPKVSKKKKNKKYTQGLTDSLFSRAALQNKVLVSMGTTYPPYYEEFLQMEMAQKTEPELMMDRDSRPSAPRLDDLSRETSKVFLREEEKKEDKTKIEERLESTIPEDTNENVKTESKKITEQEILIESDSETTTIRSQRSQVSFASKSSKNTLLGTNPTLRATSENATKTSERSLGYLRERIASKARDFSPENENIIDLKVSKNKENKPHSNNSIYANNISLDTMVYVGRASPASKESLDRRVIITNNELNENQSFYTFHQPEPSDGDRGTQREFFGLMKTLDTNNNKVILPEIGFYTTKNQTQFAIDRDFNPYVQSIKNFRKQYRKIESRGSNKPRGQNHFDTSDFIQPNFPLKPFKTRPASQIRYRTPKNEKLNLSNLTKNSQKSPKFSAPTLEKAPTPKENVPRKSSTHNGITHIMERIFSKDIEAPRSQVRNISPEQKSNAIDVQKTARLFEEGIRTRTGSIEHNANEIDRLVRADKNFDDYLSNFEATYEREMDLYSRKISKESIKQFSSELKHHIRERSYSELETNSNNSFSVHMASKTFFDQIFPNSRNSSIPSRLEIAQEMAANSKLNSTLTNFTPVKTVVIKADHTRARSVGRTLRETGKVLKINNVE